MKVVHINVSDAGGGAEQFAFDLATSSQYEGSLFVKKKKRNNSRVEEIQRASMSYYMNGVDALLQKFFGKTLYVDIGVLYPLHGSWLGIRKRDIYRQADVVCIHNIHTDYFDLDTLKQIAAEKPIVWVMHDMWSFTGGEVYVFDDEGYKSGNAVTPYANLFPFYNPIKDRRQDYLEKKKALYLELVDRITFVPVSKWLESCLRNSYVYNDRMKIQCIQNGVDTSIFYDKGERTWDKPRVLFFNSESPYKGSHLFKEEILKVKAPFDLYTVGELVPDITEQYRFDPIRNREELNDLYNTVDIMVFPSEAENFPLTVLEAMAAGVQVVGAATGGIKEQLAEERGVLFESGNGDDLRKMLESVLEKGVHNIRTEAQVGMQYVVAHWNQRMMEEHYMQLFENLTANKDS
ncbi:glycosyltransferase [Limibacter armeniacum]|uniref:glycosyltransferase n=1 Tax=Limibacter armeniacum TaxID=466084 RepID=UPI002FE65C68